MKILAFNGSPRKEWNTATLLNKILAGAQEKGAQTVSFHLYDYDYKGCVSCFACKEIGGASYGRCLVKDPLKSILTEVESADALVFGSPIYLGGVTGLMQSFLERLVFPYLTYTDPPGTLMKRKMPTACIYTMGLPEEGMQLFGYPQRFANTERLLTRIFGSCETLLCCDTYQFKDYSKVFAPRFDPVHKLKRRQEVFPQDCQKAFQLGQRLVLLGEQGRT